MRRLVFLALLFLIPFALAEGAEERADAAVTAWLEQAPVSITHLMQLDTEELCREVPALLTGAVAPPGTEVNFEDRKEWGSESPDLRVFTYAAVRPGDQLDVVEVRLREGETTGDYTVEFVGFRSQTQLRGMRAWLQTPAASFAFTIFSLIVVVLLLTRGSTLRRWLKGGFAAIREHRWLVLITVALMYGAFGLGMLTGTELPEACEQAIVDLVTGAVTMLGATEAYESGNVARAAALTFYQNFGVVTMSFLFFAALLFGIPGYLFGFFSFFTQGIPFGVVGLAGSAELVAVLVLFVLELTAYFLIIAGGGMLLRTLLGRGEGAFLRGAKKLLLMVPIAGLLLLAGAWYEAAILILGG